MIYFQENIYFFPFKLGFGSMTPKKRTLMATLLVGIDFKNVSLLFEIRMGKITHPRSKKKKIAIFIDTKSTWAITFHAVVLVFDPFLAMVPLV